MLWKGIMMNTKKFYDKMSGFEKTGSYVGNIFGKIIKKPIRLICILFPFMFVGILAFSYSFREGFKKS